VNTPLWKFGAWGGIGFSLCILCSSGAEPLKWESKFTANEYVRGTLVVPSQHLTPMFAEQLAQSAFKEIGDRRFADVEMFCEEDYPPFHYFLLSHVGYGWWKHWFDRVPRFPVARLIALNGNAVFEYGDRGGVTRRILAGSDPLLVAAGKGTFHLLHFTFKRIPLGLSKVLDAESLDVFVEVEQPLDPIAGQALFEVLSQLIPLKEIMLYIRNDKWFLDISGYPLIYPFAPEETPPAKEVFQQSHTLLCGRSVLTKESSCTLVSGH
jgi:hypothetical protein